MRSSTKGAPGLLLAALFLAVRLLASSVAMAMPAPEPIGPAAGFCHSGLGEEAPPAHDHACLVCPACHLVTHAGLPTPAPATMPILLGADLGRATGPRASTGPPHRPRVSAHPTGPPTAST